MDYELTGTEVIISKISGHYDTQMAREKVFPEAFIPERKQTKIETKPQGFLNGTSFIYSIPNNLGTL